MKAIPRQILAFLLIGFVFPFGGMSAAPSEEDSLEAEWRIKVHRDSQDNPHSKVDLVINGDQVVHLITSEEIGNYQVMSPGEYVQYKVPGTALCACYSWWAGSGTRLYAVASRNGGVDVYRMDVDEGEDAHPRWQRIRTIKVESP